MGVRDDIIDDVGVAEVDALGALVVLPFAVESASCALGLNDRRGSPDGLRMPCAHGGD